MAKKTPHRGRKPAHPAERPHRHAKQLPETTIIRVTGTDFDGDVIARPVTWDTNLGPPPLIHMRPEQPGRPALAPGERVLARLSPAGPGHYDGRTLKRIAETPARVLGVFKPGRLEHRIIPTDRRFKAEWIIPIGGDNGAKDGEIVLAEPLPDFHRLGLKPARVVERLGHMGDARSVSLICIHTYDIPTVFEAAALHEAEIAQAVPLGARTDLRDVKLITIDGEDARDFDDAVFAEPDGAGFRLIVAIADVAHYVRPGSALDETARTRGNSVYFPDRVVPMLPEALSNGWCSLRPDEDRGCLFVEMHIDAAGRKTRHRFGRGLMRSSARMTYEGMEPEQFPALYAAYRALITERTRRGTLDLDLPERKVILSDTGKVLSVAPRPRLDSHRLIEEFMVLANVAAAEELEQRRQPCMYRVHAPPTVEKLENLRGFLSAMGISLPAGDQVHPRDLDHVLRMVVDTPEAPLVNETILRSQSQAAYNPDNIGHFGLALTRYAHFTSPIRRYADLLVHRALIAGLGLGPDGLAEDQSSTFPDIAEHITGTERRAQQAERDAVDRYLAAFMAEKLGECFDARISGVTRSGLFVTVNDSGASGIVPISSLPDDYWQHDERARTLTSRRNQMVFALGQAVEVRLVEALPITGGLVFHIMPRPLSQGAPAGKRPRGG